MDHGHLVKEEPKASEMAETLGLVHGVVFGGMGYGRYGIVSCKFCFSLVSRVV